MSLLEYCAVVGVGIMFIISVLLAYIFGELRALNDKVLYQNTLLEEDDPPDESEQWKDS